MVHGDNRIGFGWAGGILFGLGAMSIFSSDIPGGVGCCFLSVIFLLMADSGHKAKKAWQAQRIIFVQQPVVQQPVVQPMVVHHNYAAPQTQPAPRPAAPVVSRTHRTPAKSTGDWAMDARNLEMARDWAGAAEAYQKAGLYAEAGRVRAAHLEKDDSTVVNIERVGDTVLHDSVMMGETEKKDPPDEF